MSTTLTDQLAAYFRARPYCWIDGKLLADVAGAYAWRSRVSDLRRVHGMTIENRIECRRGRDGRTFKLSSYRYVPDALHTTQEREIA